MKQTTLLAAVLVFGAILGLNAGCRPNSTRTTRTSEGKTNEGKANERPRDGVLAPQDTSFRVFVPERIELSRGGAQVIEVSITRGAGFRSEVKFSLQPPPLRGLKGITFAPADWMLNTTETTTKVTARAEPDAPVGTYSWTLIVRPRVGQESIRTLSVAVSP